MANTTVLNNSVKIFFLLLLACLFASCSKEEDAFANSDNTKNLDYTAEKMNVSEFINWSGEKENSLTKIKEIAEMKYRLTFLPALVMAYLELRTESYDDAKLLAASKNYSTMTYFNFKIEVTNDKQELLKHDLTSPSLYDARIKYMSFEMDKDIFLIQGKDTLRPGLYHFERIFEVAPYATTMFAFDNSLFKSNEEFTIVYNDKLFNKGFIKFNFKNKQLLNLPTIIGS